MKRHEHVQISDYIKLPQFWAFEQSPRHWLMSSPTRPLTDIYTMFLIAWIWMFEVKHVDLRNHEEDVYHKQPPLVTHPRVEHAKFQTKGVPPNFMSGADARADTQPGASKVLRASIHSCRRSWPQMLSFWVGDQREKLLSGSNQSRGNPPAVPWFFPVPGITAIEIVVSPCHVGNVISPTSKSA